jgi:hypothetical protein
VNRSLEQALAEQEIEFEPLEKREKVKLLARWAKAFPELMQSARMHRRFPAVARDAQAESECASLAAGAYYVLPDDDSGMPSYSCSSPQLPDLSELVSDTVVTCDEIVIVDRDFQWSAVLVNHGSPENVGRHFMRAAPSE